MQTATIDENSLRLTGNKIKLTTRPLESYSTASSRCALIGRSYSRPVSAVPLLNLNYNEFHIPTNTRRPLSADFPVGRFKDSSYRSNLSLSQNGYASLYADGETSMESSEETEGTLASSQLLHNLLTEPLCSWRNGIRCKPPRKIKLAKKPALKFRQASDNSDSNETPSAGSDTSSSADSVGIKSKLKTEDAATIKTNRSATRQAVGVKRHNIELPDAHCTKNKAADNQQPGSEETKIGVDSEQLSTTQSSTLDKCTVTVLNNNQQSMMMKPQHIETTNNQMSLKAADNQPSGENSQRSEMTGVNLNEENNIINKNEATCNAMPLLPGLKTKPPLPKKPDLGNSNSAKSNKKANSPYPSPKDDIHSQIKSNFEQIALNMTNYNLMIPNTGLNECGRSLNDSKFCEDIHSKETEVNNQTSTTSTLASDTDTIDLKFQTWHREEQNANNEIMESEWNTDISLHLLKFQNQKDAKNQIEYNNEDNQIMAVNSSRSNIQRNYVSNTKQDKQNSSTKVVNFQPFDVEELKEVYEKHKRNGPVKNFIKQNIKMTAGSNRKKAPVTEIIPKNKNFVSTQMKSFTDYSEPSEPLDIESWMSTNPESSSPPTRTVNDSTTNKTLCSKPPSFLDFLNEIEELEETCAQHCLEDLPEHDTMNEQTDGNTYDDIVSILQVLEEQDKKSQMKMESIKEIVSNELSFEKEDSRPKSRRASFNEPTNKSDSTSSIDCDYHHLGNETAAEKYCNDCNCSTSNKSRDQEQPSRSSVNSSTNLNVIFSYLDEVDKNCAKSLACAKERVETTTQMVDRKIRLDTIPKLEELLVHTNVELSHHIIDLSLRLKEKSSSIALLQRELSNLRNQVTKMTKDTNEIVKQRLKSQKEDYENVVKRHQKFIDQLIADKKTLNQQCEGLIHEMKVLEDRYNTNLKAAEHKHKVELQKVKEMHVAGEKIRRERWIDTKTQKIKELTVKGLEPELEKMAARHQQELTDLRSLHKREIEDLELRAARKMQQQCEALREQLTMEREKALAHEREVLRQRYEQLVESEERNYQEQRRRLLAEHANRISECEERENAAVVERDRAIKQAHNEFEDKLQAAVRRHNTELNVLKEKTELEIEAFRNSYKKQAAVQIAEKEAQIREKYRKERDKEIEAVIERLEMESNENKLQIEQSTENRIRRLRDKYETEIKDLEHTEKEATSKYSDAKSKLLQAEDLVISLKASVKQLEMQLQETKEFSDKLSKERSKIKEVVKDEMKQEIQTLEKELLELKNGKDKELQQVYARVKVAVARKDETISELTRDHTALQDKCAYLENMLEQQRKEYLIK